MDDVSIISSFSWLLFSEGDLRLMLAIATSLISTSLGSAGAGSSICLKGNFMSRLLSKLRRLTMPIMRSSLQRDDLR